MTGDIYDFCAIEIKHNLQHKRYRPKCDLLVLGIFMDHLLGLPCLIAFHMVTVLFHLIASLLHRLIEEKEALMTGLPTHLLF